MKMQKTPVGETSLTGVRLNRIFWYPEFRVVAPLAPESATIKYDDAVFCTYEKIMRLTEN